LVSTPLFLGILLWGAIGPVVRGRHQLPRLRPSVAFTTSVGVHDVARRAAEQFAVERRATVGPADRLDRFSVSLPAPRVKPEGAKLLAAFISVALQRAPDERKLRRIMLAPLADEGVQLQLAPRPVVFFQDRL
jgi:hypothetical protein